MTENITFKIKRSGKIDHVSTHGATERGQGYISLLFH